MSTITGLNDAQEASNPLVTSSQPVAQGGRATSYRGVGGSEASISEAATSALGEGNTSRSNPAPNLLTRAVTYLKSIISRQPANSDDSSCEVSSSVGGSSESDNLVEPSRRAKIWKTVCNFFSRAPRNDASAGSDEEPPVSRASGEAASNPKSGYLAERKARNDDVASFNAAIETVRKYIKDGVKNENIDLETVLRQVPDIYREEARKACRESIEKAAAHPEDLSQLKQIANVLRECKKQDVSESADFLSGLAKGIGNFATWEVNKFFKKRFRVIEGSSGYLNPFLWTKGATYQFFAKYATKEYTKNRFSDWLNGKIHDGSKLGITKSLCTIAAGIVGVTTFVASSIIRALALGFGLFFQTFGAVILTGIVLGGIGAGLYFGGHALAGVIGVGLAATAIAFAIFAVGSVGYAIYTNIRFNRLQKTLTEIQSQLATLQGAGRARDPSQLSPEQSELLNPALLEANAELRRDGAEAARRAEAEVDDGAGVVDGAAGDA
jgi:preprotein translocase subunit Sss1